MMHKRLGSSRTQVASGRASLARSILPVAAKHSTAISAKQQPDDSLSNISDPEAKYHRYGKDFGRGFKLDDDWLESVPRIRVRKADHRQLEELVELAVLNERLSGGISPWEARKRLEYLRIQRKNWERIFEYITEQDAAATLAVIEEANRKVEAALSEEERERTSVGALKRKLQDLQEEVEEAQSRLQLTQSRVQQNLQRVNMLKAEATTLERMQRTTVSERAATTASVVQDKPSTSYSPIGTATSLPRRSKPVGRAKVRDLQSSLEMEDGLRNFWYPAEFSSKLGKDTLVPFEIFNEPWVMFRDERGQPACIKDECAHRACPLSLGKVVEGQVQCAYHGWEFNSDGACTKMPSTMQCKNVGVAALPCAEKDGFIWVWPGDGLPPDVPDYTKPPAGYTVHSEIVLEVPVEHGLLMENLLDLAHAPFTHTSTFARGWPVPDFVKFHANKMLSGNWDPYPISMAFQPPCMVLSLIGLAQPGKIMRGVTAEVCEKHLHQLHVCMPAKRGHTRLLYRMSLDFMGWVQYVPFIDRVWKAVAGQVLGEDLVLVQGQQDRLKAGSNTWANPVSYDKLAVRYRRWRNSLTDGSGKGAVVSTVMTAGDMFSVDEDAEEEMMADEQCRVQVDGSLN